MSHIRIRLGEILLGTCVESGLGAAIPPPRSVMCAVLVRRQDAAGKLEMRFNSVHGAPKYQVSVGFQTYLALN